MQTVRCKIRGICLGTDELLLSGNREFKLPGTASLVAGIYLECNIICTEKHMCVVIEQIGVSLMF